MQEWWSQSSGRISSGRYFLKTYSQMFIFFAFSDVQGEQWTELR